jgi:hypothetical protein
LIAVPWADWQAAANLSSNVEEWTKDELKQWISNFLQYTSAIEAFITAHAPSVTTAGGSVVVGGVTVANTTGPSPVIDFSNIISFVESLNITVPEVQNFTDVWSATYDLPDVSVTQVIADLSVASNIV